jgi:hypothetical protein
MQEQLVELKHHDFAWLTRNSECAGHCLDGLYGRPRPVIRDGVAFEGISSWMRGQQLSAETVLSLNDKLQVQIQSTADPNGFQQPFAALLLAEVARVDRLETILTSAMRDELVDVAAKYLAGVNDYRGFSSTEGWRHGVAHGSDLVVQLVLNPNILPGQAEQLMAAVATQIAPAGEMFYVAADGRLARAAFYAWSRGLVDDDSGTTGSMVLSIRSRWRTGRYHSPASQDWRSGTTRCRSCLPCTSMPCWLVTSRARPWQSGWCKPSHRCPAGSS